jgi:Flp pilus assembly protein TadG
MVELAIVAIVLFILLFGIFEMGLVVYDYNMVCSAAREAVRYAIVHPGDTTGIQNAAINSAPFLSPSCIANSTCFQVNTSATDPNGYDQDVKVTINLRLHVAHTPSPFLQSHFEEHFANADLTHPHAVIFNRG